MKKSNSKAFPDRGEKPARGRKYGGGGAPRTPVRYGSRTGSKYGRQRPKTEENDSSSDGAKNTYTNMVPKYLRPRRPSGESAGAFERRPRKPRADKDIASEARPRDRKYGDAKRSRSDSAGKRTRFDSTAKRTRTADSAGKRARPDSAGKRTRFDSASGQTRADSDSKRIRTTEWAPKRTRFDSEEGRPRTDSDAKRTRTAGSAAKRTRPAAAGGAKPRRDASARPRRDGSARPRLPKTSFIRSKPRPKKPAAGATFETRQDGRWRLQRWMAFCGVASRRACEELITQARVSINGKITTLLGTTIDPENDEVRVDSELIGRNLHTGPEIWMIHKPAGVASTLSDPHAVKTLTNIIPYFLKSPGRRFFPIGRLDQDSEGLMFLTSDGSLAHRLSHPRYEVEKEYEVTIAGDLSGEILARWANGVDIPALDEERLSHGDSIRMRARAKFLEGPHSVMRGGKRKLIVILQEGRKRQIRRMVSAAGAHVVRLRRIRIGPVTLGDLPAGSCAKIEGQLLEELLKFLSLPTHP